MDIINRWYNVIIVARKQYGGVQVVYLLDLLIGTLIIFLLSVYLLFDSSNGIIQQTRLLKK